MMMMKWSTHPTAALAKSALSTRQEKRNCSPPTATATISHFPRATSTSQCRKHYFSASGIISLWIVVLVWCSPRYVANGLPLVMMGGSPHSVQDVILDLRGVYVSPQRWLHWHLHEKKNKLGQEMAGDDKDDSSVQDWNYGDGEQEATGLVKPYESGEAVVEPPRKKKGLSYLTKYYSEAFLNNTPNSGGGGSGSASSNTHSHHDSSNRFFGRNVGTGSSSASGEQRFPSSVRRKLSFYPPLTSHSVFMSPWSRSGTGFASSGRSPTMRLRWGK